MAKLSPLVVIVGETASGKSSLAMQLARKYSGEIICADSRTIYKGMDIGTAKPSKKDREEMKHYLLDIIEPGERYSASQFKQDAVNAINDITKRGKLPIMVGGTGLYIDAVIFDYGFSDGKQARNPTNSRHLSQDTLHKKNELRQNTLVIGLDRSREEVKNNIEQRVEQMIQAGYIEEVKILLTRYGKNNSALSGIDYRTVVKYIEGELTLNEVKLELIKGDKSLAKRQRTWFRRNKNINWIKPNQAEAKVKYFLNVKEVPARIYRK